MKDEKEYQEEEQPKEKNKKAQVELTSVVKETDVAWKLPTGEVVNFYEYMTWIGNKIYEITKAV